MGDNADRHGELKMNYSLVNDLKKVYWEQQIRPKELKPVIALSLSGEWTGYADTGQAIVSSTTLSGAAPEVTEYNGKACNMLNDASFFWINHKFLGGGSTNNHIDMHSSLTCWVAVGANTKYKASSYVFLGNRK